MASEYNLKIKANLDTSDIKNQLASLNNANVGSSPVSIGMEQQINKITQILDRFGQQLEKLGRTTENVNTQQEISYRRLGRFAMGHVLGSSLNAASQYAFQMGENGYGYGLKYGGDFAQSTMMGFAAGGPVGAVIGAGSAGINSIADYWVNKANNLQNALDTFNNVDSMLKAFSENNELKDLIRNKDVAGLKRLQLQTGTLINAEQEVVKRTAIGDSLAEAKAYKEAADELMRLTNKSRMLSEAIESIEREAKAKAKQDQDKRQAEDERKKKEEERAKELAKKEEERRKKIIDTLKKQDERDKEHEEIQKLVKTGDVQDLLVKWQKRRDEYAGLYEKALIGGNAEDALNYRDMLVNAKRNISDLQDGMAGSLQNRYGDLVDQLQKQLAPIQSVSDMASIGGSMGWIDQNVNEQINNNVQHITNQLDRIIGQMRLSSNTNVILN